MLNPLNPIASAPPAHHEACREMPKGSVTLHCLKGVDDGGVVGNSGEGSASNGYSSSSPKP